MNYSNANHLVNRTAISKVASPYDVLSVSNRPEEKRLKVASLTPGENDDLTHYINKTAHDITGHELVKTAGEGMDKEAFLSGGVDLFTRAKGLLGQKMGVPEDTAHQMASPLISKIQKVQETYGGDANNIMDRIVEEMQNQMIDKTTGNSTLPLGGDMRDNMIVTNTKGLEQHIKQRLVTEMRFNHFEAERYTKTIVGESRDLVTMVRPQKMPDIADAIVDMAVAHRDITLIYNLKDNQAYLQELRENLGHV